MDVVSLAWLAGFIDADGSVAMRGHATCTSMAAVVQVAGTDPRARDRVISIYTEAGIKFSLADVKTDVRGLLKGRENHARAWNVSVSRREDTHRLLTLIRPYLVCKQDRADLIIEFLSNRMHETGRGRSAKPYRDRDHDIYREVKRLQKSFKEYAVGRGSTGGGPSATA